MIATSFAEAVSIGAVVPFLSLLISPEKIPYNAEILYTFNIIDTKKITLLITIVFCSLSLISGMLRLLLLRANARLSFSMGADISFDIYRKTLYQPYITHISRNSNQIIDGISTKTNMTTNYINAILTSITSIIILISIIVIILYQNGSKTNHHYMMLLNVFNIKWN
jgi:ATP-binding cassette subfamily B protein